MQADRPICKMKKLSEIIIDICEDKNIPVNFTVCDVCMHYPCAYNVERNCKQKKKYNLMDPAEWRGKYLKEVKLNGNKIIKN